MSVRLTDRTRTNHQSVMECGHVRPAHPVGHPFRSPRVLLDFPGFLILESTTRVLWNMVRARPATLVGHPSRSSGVVVFRAYPAAGRTRLSARPFSVRPRMGWNALMFWPILPSMAPAKHSFWRDEPAGQGRGCPQV